MMLQRWAKPFKTANRMVSPEEITGLAAGVLTAASMLPQLLKTIKTREVKELSVYIFILLIIGTGLWVYYGVLKNDFPLIITNAFSFLLNSVMLGLKIAWTRKE